MINASPAETPASAAVTPKVERKYGGMPKYAFLMPYWSRIGGQKFLSRFIIFYTPIGGLHVTRIHTADNQRDWPHDHSRTFVSFKLSGSYDEDVFSGEATDPARRHRKHRWLSCHVMKHSEAHSITRVSPVTVTVLFLGPRRHGSDYWTPDGKRTIGMKTDEWG